MAQILAMDEFVYLPETVHTDWPQYKLRFETYLRINRVGYVIVVADLTATPPIVGENTSMALNYLLHSGGNHIRSIHGSEQPAEPFTYVTFTAVLATRFTADNPQITDYNFREGRQMPNESMIDFVTRLRVLAKAAQIPNDQIDAQILIVIRTNSLDLEIKRKCLDRDITLTSFLTWKRQHGLVDNCIAAMDHKASNTINKIDSTIPQECGNCGKDVKHKYCPAKGKSCNKCGKINHFASKCRSSNSNQNGYSNANNFDRPANNRYNNRSYQPNNNNNQSNNNYARNSTFNDTVNSTRRTLRDRGHLPPFNRQPTINQPIRSIRTFTEEELLQEFETFYRDRLDAEDAQAIDDTQDMEIRMVSTQTTFGQWEAIHEMSTEQLDKCPRTILTVSGNRVQHLVDTGTNLNILSSSAYDALSLKPLLRATRTKAFGFTSKLRIPLRGEFTDRKSVV